MGPLCNLEMDDGSSPPGSAVPGCSSIRRYTRLYPEKIHSFSRDNAKAENSIIDIRKAISIP